MVRGAQDGNRDLVDFCETLEKVCIATVESGKMTKDLALCVHGAALTPDHYLTTEAFLDLLAVNLGETLGK